MTVDEVMTSCRTDQSAHITSACVEDAIKTLPNGKSGGPDGIVYEHLRLSKEIISPILAILFTNMLRHAFIPKDMKRGIIITLHKEGNKKKDDPNCYRAITLSSCILKLYELMLLNRCAEDLQNKLARQQCGFQRGLGCLMTSFRFRECIHFAKENSSKVYVCYLDGKQA